MTATETPDTPAVFEPSPGLVELHATATRLLRNIERASTFSPRLRMRYDQAQRIANERWAAEVAAFEAANADTETPEEMAA